eukprot:1639336-Rhodomonas_salina.3
MGCKESKDQDAGSADPAWNGSRFRDPAEAFAIGKVEADAHIAAWKDGGTRLRLENKSRDENGSSALRATLSLDRQEEDEVNKEPKKVPTEEKEPASRSLD